MKQRRKGPDLFEQVGEGMLEREAPLASRMRPRSFDEFVGQEHFTDSSPAKAGSE